MDERSDSLESAAAYAVECFKGLCERVVMMSETLDRSVPRDAMERRCARLQRQIDESHAAIRRRNARMAEISTERDELRAEVASMRKRLNSFRPRYVEYHPVKVEPPAPKVLDADGVEIRPGDTVCGTRDMEPMRVVDTDSDECGFKKIKCEKEGDGFWFYCPDELTHKLPVLAADGEPLEVGQTVWRDDGEELEVLYLRPDGLVDCCGEIERPECLTHQRPVLDADGVPITNGESVYEIGGDGARLTVVRTPKRGEYQAIVVKLPDGNETTLDPPRLTHAKPEPPDSIEKVASDLMKMAEVWCSKPLLKDAQSCAAAQVGESTLGDALKSVSRRCGALAERGER